MNTTNDFKKKLLTFIEKYLKDDIDFDEFVSLYYDFYIECEDQDVYDLNEKDSDFFMLYKKRLIGQISIQTKKVVMMVG